jgi:hypothetical protein
LQAVYTQAQEICKGLDEEKELMINTRIFWASLVIAAILIVSTVSAMKITARADEPLPANCDYQHVAMLFGAREQKYVMYHPYDLLAPEYGILYKYSVYGLPYDPVYNLVENPSHPALKSEVIDMRDVAQAIINYCQQHSASLLLKVGHDIVSGSGDRVLTHPEADLDRDGIDDSFETEIADAIASGRGDQMVTVFSQLSTPPTNEDVAIFEQHEGILTSRLFTRGPRSFGFAGEIPYNRIVDYVAGNIRIGYLEDFDAGPSLNMAYGTTQIF